ncbi:MAG: hypothetical protein JWQ38_437 [Flavipsychrobacter sp.]|nr:hypothetical protein [Flavipsychrobacter sp.]
MRVTCLLLTLAFMQNATAQDFCKRIKKEVSDDKTTFTYTSPFDESDKPVISVKRMFNLNPEEGMDNFLLQLRISGPLDDIYTKNAEGGQVEKDEKSVVIEFDDHSNFTDETIPVDHDISDDRIFAIRYLNLPLTDDNIKAFTSKKIVKFSLAGSPQAIVADTANAIMHYIQCIKTVK